MLPGSSLLIFIFEFPMLCEKGNNDQGSDHKARNTDHILLSSFGHNVARQIYYNILFVWQPNTLFRQAFLSRRFRRKLQPFDPGNTRAEDEKHFHVFYLRTASRFERLADDQ